MPSPRTNMSDKLRVLFDTTVFCGALVKPDGGNMRCLLLANAPFFDPVISQGVLAEFIHSATVRGLGHGRNRRLYHYEEVREFLEALAPLWDHAVPVGLRAVLPDSSGGRVCPWIMPYKISLVTGRRRSKVGGCWTRRSPRSILRMPT